jgi:hypothetical protein
MRILSKWSFLLVAALLWACEEEGSMDDNPNNNNGTLKMNISNLENLGSAEVYEAWIIVDGSPVSAGTFTVDDNGTLSNDELVVNQEMLNDAVAFVLTIEPNPDPDPAPSDIKLIGGDFQANSATVDVSHMAALGDDFSGAAGKYILATPTTNDMTDELSGIWFLDLSSGMPGVGLTLPGIGSNWVYEGWAVINGTPVSTGRFTAADMMDDSGVFSGSDAGGPPFPGEDFITNAPAGLTFPTDLSGGTAVISIEPEPDNSPAPFMLKPLVAGISASAMDHVTYDLNNMSGGTFPAGTVTR